MVVKSEILCASGHLYLISSIRFYVRMFYVRTDRCVGDANKRYFPVNRFRLCEIDNGPSVPHSNYVKHENFLGGH